MIKINSNLIKNLSICLMFSIILSACEEKPSQERLSNIKFDAMKVNYPPIQKDTIVDDFFGTKVPDPYRWLEDPNSEATTNWVTQQNEVTFDYLSKIPYRKAFNDRLSEIYNYARYSTPNKKAGKYFYFKNDGLQNQSVMYMKSSLDGEETLVLDPNKFSSDGTTSLANYSISKDGKFLAYGISEGGSDWRTIKVKDLKDGTLLEDNIEWVKFSSINWFKNGFFYSRYPEPQEGAALTETNLFHKVYYHKLGTSQADDELIFADNRNPNYNFYTDVTDDERFLVIYVAKSTSGNALYFKDLSQENATFKNPVSDFDADYTVVDNINDKLLVLTNKDAGNYRLILIDVENPSLENWEEFVPTTDNVLSSATVIGNKVIMTYIEDAKSMVKSINLDGTGEKTITLPGTGSVGGFSGSKGDNEAFFSFTSFTQPTSIYKFDVNNATFESYIKPDLKFNPEDYETKQVFFESKKDGTRVPMFITYKKGIKLDGSNPTLLYGYGGFNISIMPSYNPVRIPILENGGIYAVANIRGGGEYGTEWHKSGTLLNKQNVFDDFISAAEYLIEQNYTSSKKIAIEGRSNGGLLVGATMLQRPDLFKVAFPGVGVMDMLRYHKFTIGRAWATDYGISEEDEANFKNLYAYSPVHNVKNGVNYPATMVTTADHDDRVVPAHSYKFISALQAGHKGDNPVFIRIDTSAGHGAGKPVSKRIEEFADMLAFMFYNMKEQVIYPLDSE